MHTHTTSTRPRPPTRCGGSAAQCASGRRRGPGRGSLRGRCRSRRCTAPPRTPAAGPGSACARVGGGGGGQLSCGGRVRVSEGMKAGQPHQACGATCASLPG
jgi:hypothetical protein